jgi:hypothetical protein
VPTAAQRSGDFTAQASRVVIDPLSKQPFPNSLIPQSRFDPLAQKLLLLGALAQRSPIIASNSEWTPIVGAGGLGAAEAHGAFATTSATNLPSGGPYRVYWTLKVVKTGPFNLLYGSTSAATNLATPFVQAIESTR